MTPRSFFSDAEDRFVLGDVLADILQLFENFVDGELRQAIELQFEDGVGLASTVKRLLRIELGRATGGVDVDLLAAEVGDQVFAGIARDSRCRG